MYTSAFIRRLLNAGRSFLRGCGRNTPYLQNGLGASGMEWQNAISIPSCLPCRIGAVLMAMGGPCSSSSGSFAFRHEVNLFMVDRCSTGQPEQHEGIRFFWWVSGLVPDGMTASGESADGFTLAAYTRAMRNDFLSPIGNFPEDLLRLALC